MLTKQRDLSVGANIGPDTAAATSKTTPADADVIPLSDSAASNVLKSLSWANIKTALNSLYAKVGGVGSSGITMNTARLLGRTTASSGAIEEISAGTGISLSSTTIAATQVPASSNTTVAASDAGKCLEVSANITIPNSVMSAGDVINIFNNSAGNITIVASIGTLYLAGTANTGNRTLAQRGIASVRFISGTVAVIAGAGLT